MDNMTMNKYQKEVIDEKKKQAFKYYQGGLTLRQVGSLIGRSHEWVRQAVEELTKNETANILKPKVDKKNEQK